MAYLLFPGRHLAHTNFQEYYLRQVLKMPLEKLMFSGGKSPGIQEPLDQVIYAVSSANQENSRYSPVPFFVRALGIDRFAAEFKQAMGIGYRIFPIPHYRRTDRFAEFIIKEIAQASERGLKLTPENCVVLCSTPEVITQFEALGFTILEAENAAMLPTGGVPLRPGQLLEKIALAGADWFYDSTIRTHLSFATLTLFEDFPEIPVRLQRLWRDPILTESGSLTETRNYATYAYDMGNAKAIELKYNDIKEVIKEGKIVDEGCADGALLSPIARDFPDSDLIGIDITAEFIARCRERQRAGDFGQTFIYFHQRNILDAIFEPASIDTTICNSTTHELWSYNQQAQTLMSYLALKFEQTRPGGRIVIRDVVGPENQYQTVWLWTNDSDGSNRDFDKKCTSETELKDLLDGLSTRARFYRFAQDFLSELRASGRRGPETVFTYTTETIGDKLLFKLSLKNAVEFMSRKDYTDNWQSEMNEEFAYWSFSQWKTALEQVGFQIIENPNRPEAGSRVYVNPWIVANRWEGKCALFTKDSQGVPVQMEWPVTTMVLVGERV